MTRDAARPDEVFLVLRAQLGDRDAFDQLFSAISPRLLRYIHAILQNAAAAEDVLQDVLLIIYRKIHWLRDPAHFHAWTYRLAAREAIRAAGRGRKHREAQLTDVEWNAIQFFPVAAHADARLLGDAIVRGISHLPPASRAVLSLHYIEDLDLRTAAAVLDIPIGTAKSRLSFGIQRLRQQLGIKK